MCVGVCFLFKYSKNGAAIIVLDKLKLDGKQQIARVNAYLPGDMIHRI